MINYSKIFTEVEQVLLVLDESLKEKIPDEVKKMISENSDKSYVFKFDNSKPIYEQNITKEAKAILATIYREYLCADEEKKKWKEYDRFRLIKIEELKKKNYQGK